MSAGDSHENRRHFSRIPMDSEVTLKCDTQQWKGKLIDVSLKGALLEEPEGFHSTPGNSCRLSLTLSEANICIEMDGEIVHHENGHLGIRCDSIDLDSITHLKRIVELNLGDEALLERELGELVEIAK